MSVYFIGLLVVVIMENMNTHLYNLECMDTVPRLPIWKIWFLPKLVVHICTNGNRVTQFSRRLANQKGITENELYSKCEMLMIWMLYNNWGTDTHKDAGNGRPGLNETEPLGLLLHTLVVVIDTKTHGEDLASK